MGDWYENNEGDWVYDANAPSPSVAATEIRPHTRAVLDAIHGDVVHRSDAPTPPDGRPEVPRAGDIGDWIDPNAPDPTPDEVVDRSDPNYVDPWFGR